MADHRAGGHTEVAEGVDQRDLDREDAHLRVLDLVGLRIVEHHFHDRVAGLEVDELVDLIEVPAEHRVRRVQLLGHLPVLGAEAREHPHRAAGGRRVRGQHPGRLDALGQRAQPLDEFGARACEHRAARAGVVSPCERAGHRGEVEVVALGFEPVGEPRRGLAAARGQRAGHYENRGGLGDVLETRVGVGRHGLGNRARGSGRRAGFGISAVIGRTFGVGGRGVLREHDVRVGAAEAEAGHAGDRGARVARPRRLLGHDRQARGVEVDVGVGAGEVDGRRQLVVLHREHDLEQPGGARGGLEVSEVGLGRAEQRRGLARAAVAEYRAECVRLDRVAEDRARAVRLDVVDRGRIDAGVGVRVGEYLRLRFGVRGGHAVGATVGIDRGTVDDGEDRVPVALRIAAALEHEEAAALGAADAVGVRGERLDPSVRGQRGAGLGKAHRRGGGDHHVHATGDGDIGLTCAQRLHGFVYRDERRRARGVEGERRPAEVVGVGHAAGDDRTLRARHRVRGRCLGICGDHRLEVGRGRADEHADLFSLELVRRDMRVLQRLPGELEREALLRVDHLGLAGAHPEELGVEVLDLVFGEPPRSAGRLGEDLLHVRVGGPLLPPLGGALGGAVLAGGEQVPHGLRITHAAGEARGNADDCDLAVLRRTGHTDGDRGGDGRDGILGARPLDEVLGQRRDRWVLVGDGGVERAPEQLLELAGQRHRVAGGQAIAFERGVVVDARDVLAGRVGDPSTQPVAHLCDGHLVLCHYVAASKLPRWVRAFGR